MASGWIPRGASRAKGNVVSVVFIFALVSIFVLSGCGGSSGNAHTGPRVLTSLGFVGGSFTQNMSPFSSNVNVGIEGLVYENLEFVNGVTGQETGMLATGHQYSADNKQLTFTTRPNVKWSDNQAFSANDVA
ncbi:MAG TPA: ABC transporter substrate-binding protein, partial [Ktedonobacterales bacterium]|nr:ABC transporter substrate-binding protein [Ktedonobacterales bacterium]